MTELGQWSTSSLSDIPSLTGHHSADAENKNTLAHELTDENKKIKNTVKHTISTPRYNKTPSTVKKKEKEKNTCQQQICQTHAFIKSDIEVK